MTSGKTLQPYEEVWGRLTDLAEDSSSLLAVIGQVRVRLPLEMKSKLEPLLGYRVALLRTDLASQDYRCRMIEGDR
jgi:hypothetical protein